MKTLSKEQLEEKARLIDKLAGAKADLEALIAEYNDKVAEAYKKVEDEATHYNSVLEEVRNFVEDVHTEMESHRDAQAESWEDGDEGQAYDTWKSAWEEMMSKFDDTYDLEEQSPLSDPDDLGAEFEDLADAPGA